MFRTASTFLTLACAGAVFGQDNVWITPNLRFILPSGLPGAYWATSDGYCTALARASNGTVLWRSGVGQNSSVAHPKLDPGFYSNATLAWAPATDSVRVVDIFNWDGGSYSEFSPLPAFSTDTTPVPRHTYDGLAYVEADDALYLMLGAYGRGAPSSGLARDLYLLDDTASTWKFTFSDGKWRRIRGNIRRFWTSVYTVSNYESHLRLWPRGGKLLFVDDGGTHHAEFDLQSETWTNVSSSSLRSPFSLYGARSAWDSKREIWIFRNGKEVCTYNPSGRTYLQVPNIRTDTARGRGIAYDSRHDVYIAPIEGAAATAVYSPQSGVWTEISGGVTLPDAWAAYDSLSDWVCYVNQQTALKFRYNPATAGVAQSVPPAQFSFGLSPNPVRGHVRLTFGGFSLPVEVTVTTPDGKLMKRFAATNRDPVLNPQGWPAGVYLVMARAGARTASRKIVLQR